VPLETYIVVNFKAHGISRGARKLAPNTHINKNKKETSSVWYITLNSTNICSLCYHIRYFHITITKKKKKKLTLNYNIKLLFINFMIELVFKHQQNILWVLCNILVVIKDYSKTIDNEKTKKKKHLRSWLSGGRGLFPSSAPGFEPHCACLSSPRCLTCSLGLQDVHWVCRMFTGSWD